MSLDEQRELLKDYIVSLSDIPGGVDDQIIEKYNLDYDIHDLNNDNVVDIYNTLFFEKFRLKEIDNFKTAMILLDDIVFNSLQETVNNDAPWVDVAKVFDGIDERNPNERPLISLFHKAAGANFDYTVPWCASFVSYCLKEAGVTGNRPFSTLSQFFCDSKDYIKIDAPKYGAIAVWKNSNSNSGHVAFVLERLSEDEIMVIGGNQMPYTKENVATAVTKSRRSISGNAKRKFRNFYWPKFFKIDDAKELNHKVLSKTLIDTYLRRTGTITQTAINSIIKENNIHLDLLEVDGVMGKLTINAINELNKISVDIFNQSYYITREDVFKSKTTMSKILRVANLFNKEDF